TRATQKLQPPSGTPTLPQGTSGSGGAAPFQIGQKHIHLIGQILPTPQQVAETLDEGNDALAERRRSLAGAFAGNQPFQANPGDPGRLQEQISGRRAISFVPIVGARTDAQLPGEAGFPARTEVFSAHFRKARTDSELFSVLQ